MTDWLSVHHITDWMSVPLTGCVCPSDLSQMLRKAKKDARQSLKDADESAKQAERCLLPSRTSLLFLLFLYFLRWCMDFATSSSASSCLFVTLITTLHYTYCYHVIKGIQDLKIYSHADSPIHSLFVALSVCCNS